MKAKASLFIMLLLWILGICPAALHAGEITYIYTDPLGTTLAEANAQGNITATFDYRPFGALALGSASTQSWFAGHINDPATALVYMQARYYDPAIGRFLSVDPAGERSGTASTFGRYQYAENNPATNIDPDGRQTLPPSTYTLDWTKPETRQAFQNYAASMVPGYGIYNCAAEGCGKVGWGLAVVSTGLTAASIASKVTAPLRAARSAAPARSPLMQRYLSESGGRWGNASTRTLNDRIATQLEQRGYTVVGGAGRASEEWIPGVGGGTKGGTFVDITATNGSQTIRVQTVTTLADGVTPTASELAAAQRIQAAYPNDILQLVPKQQ